MGIARLFVPLLVATSPALGASVQEPHAARPPNVVLILADDLGSGDLGCDNPDSRIPTPRLDALAREGLRFTDAHSPSAVCTPTRYALLTGRYAWRTRLKQGVLWGWDPLLIEPGRPTLASMLRQHGYATAVFGKWHLGLGVFDPQRPDALTDFARPVEAGPRTVGFDHALVLPASLDIPPYFYLAGDRPLEPPSAVLPGSELRRLGGGGFWRAGPAAPSFDHERALPFFTESALAWLRRQRAEHPEQPFFLYLPLTAPHVPWVPPPAFRGRSQAGWYGDAVVHADAVVGELLDALAETGAAADTLVVFASDNGAHWMPADIDQWAHRANGDWRGQKADIHEGGHRVPLIVRWPGRIAAGTVSDALLGLNDVYATLADLLRHPLAAGEAEDSLSFLPALLHGAPSRRNELVLHSFDGMFALRQGDWKLIEGLGSGGFTLPARIPPQPGGPRGQLYDLRRDPREERNRWSDQPEAVKRLSDRLRALRGW